MFKQLGPPQLFLTFTCNDFAEEYVNLLQEKKPWEDPVLFTMHFKRCFHHFFTTYITKSSFARKVGGIKDWSYTIELQDRGNTCFN